MSDSDLNNLPCFDVASAISKIPVLQNIDIDKNLPSQINFLSKIFSIVEKLPRYLKMIFFQPYIVTLGVLQPILINFLFCSLN